MADLSITPKDVRALEGAIVTTANAGEAMSVGDLVYLETDGDWNKTDADTGTTLTGTLGIVVAGSGNGGLPNSAGTIANGERITVLLFGRVNLNVTLSAKVQYFASNTAGKISNTVGTVTRRIGSAETTDGIFFFNPNTTAATS